MRLPAPAGLAPQADHGDCNDQWDRRGRGFACQRADLQSLPVPLVLGRVGRHAAGFAGKQSPAPGRDAKMRRLNKELARRTQGGKNWLKTKEKLGRLHYEIACIRLDWLHKLTTEIAKTSGIVAVEDLHVKGLIRNRCLSRSFSDAAVGKLLDLLEIKVPRHGGMLLKVDRFFPSSQLCHCCGTRKKDLTLADRIFGCSQIPTAAILGIAMKMPR